MITPVIPNDTPNAGRVSWNNSDSSLQAEVDAVEAALDAHKASSDHDTRYYTEAEIDAKFDALRDPLGSVSYQIYSPVARAGGSAGNTPTPLNDFAETSTTAVLKAYGTFLKRPIDKKLILVGRAAHSTGGSNKWHVRLDAIAEDGITTVSGSDEDNNTVGFATPNLRIELDITSLPSTDMCQWSIFLKNVGTGTASMFANFTLIMSTQ